MKKVDIMAENPNRKQAFGTQKKQFKATHNVDLSVPSVGSYKLPSDFDNKFEAVSKKLNLKAKWINEWMIVLNKLDYYTKSYLYKYRLFNMIF